MIQIRPVSDLRNKFPEIEMLVNEGQPVYLTKNGYGAMVVLSLEEYASLVDNVEMKLDEADKTVYVLDRVEDTLWYHYIQDATNREIPSKKYSQEDFEIMVENFDKMKRDYSEHIFELKNLIEGLKEKLNDKQSGKP